MLISRSTSCAFRSIQSSRPAARTPVLARALPSRHQQISEAPTQSSDVVPSSALTALSLMALTALPAFADEAAVPVPPIAPFSGFSPIELGLLLSPVIIYGIFSVYRDKVNPKATVSDLLLIVALLVILGNIGSIIFLKVRFF